jgi:ribosomal protein L24
MNRIRKGDQVVVIAGKDKGQKGEVVRVAGDKVVVSNVNMSSVTPSRIRRPTSRAASSSVRRRSIFPT